MTTHNQEHNQKYFDDPILGRIPVIQTKNIPVQEYFQGEFIPFELTKVESEFRYKRFGNTVQEFKINGTSNNTSK